MRARHQEESRQAFHNATREKIILDEIERLAVLVHHDEFEVEGLANEAARAKAKAEAEAERARLADDALALVESGGKWKRNTTKLW